MNQIECKVIRRPDFRRGIELYLYGAPERQGDAINVNGEMVSHQFYLRCEPIKDDSFEFPPTLTLPDSVAQRLCDALWDAGIRPSNGEGSVGQLAAVESHLQDMRQLAFHVLKVPQK